MKKKLVILGLISLFVFTLMRFGIESVPINTNNSLQPKQVIENYYKFYNEKNREGLLTTLTKWHDQSNVNFGFDNLIFTKFVSIGDNDMTTVNAYLGCGRGSVNGVESNNVVAYKVIFVSLDKWASPWPSGIQTKGFTLIRESDDAPWG
ncbi:DUF4829 domain-containing protein [Desulfosporosinus sp. FKA]|uniref:DUF4829 domain-containing protein n=1 Tax=Desulfosporosinus sp. FKA TaxID=1969834 RepID=UPI0015571F0C|nr:DUF4829 domain-containing protein [Desulfosporosinus sp. FKA]